MFANNTNLKQTPLAYDVLISGMGPAGLAAAIELINAGKSVVIVTNRSPQFLRIQGIILSEEKRKYLADMVVNENITEEDKKFLISLNQDIAICIKEIEKFLYRRLVSFKIEGKAIDFIFQSELKKIDIKKGEATLGQIINSNLVTNNNLKTLSFKYLVCSDGKNRHALSLVENDIGKKTNFVPDSNASKHHTFHVNLYLFVKRKNNKPFIMPKLAFNSIVQNGYLSFTSVNNRYIRKHGNEDMMVIKYHYSAEVPSYIRNISETERNKYVLEKAKEAILTTLPAENGDIEVTVVPPSKKHGIAKDKLKSMFFETHLAESDLVVIEDSNQFNAKVILAGDNCRSSNYQLGHGLLDAFSHAKVIPELVKDEISSNEYFKIVKALNLKNSMRGKLFDSNKDFASQALNEKAARIINSFQNAKL